MKITIETTEKVTKEFEIKLPYYSRYANLFYYKVISEKLMIKVTNEQCGNVTTELTTYCIDSAFRDGTEQIKYLEFKNALISATQKIVNS